MKHLPSLLALAFLAFASTLAQADPITYTFNQTYTRDANSYFTVTGTLTTDGVIGAVATSDITGYDLFVSETTYGRASAELSAANSSAYVNGGLNATASSLVFDFSGSNAFFFEGGGLPGVLDYTYNSISFGGLGIGVVTVFENGPHVIASVASAQTPEPSSLLLLGTGALGVAGAVRRRLVRA